nr:malonyl-ACP O-methyltransferase BioC [Acinetobacter sp. Marseille-Q1620]
MDDLTLKINKSQVAQRFAKASQSYDQHAFVQKDICYALIGLMRRFMQYQSLERVFEIGCGSGNLTQLLLQNFKVNQLFLNDIYPEVQQHFQIQQNLDFYIGDIEQIAFPESLDLICSSSALQWVENLDQIFQKANIVLNSKGYFCFSTFGLDNLKEIRLLTGQGLDYLALSDIHNRLIQQGFEILYLSEEHKILGFDQPKDILNHLKATGVTATASGHRWTKSSLQQFNQGYQQFLFKDAGNQLKYQLTYHPIYCIARRGV